MGTADDEGCSINLSGCDVPPGDWYVTLVGAGTGICDSSPLVISVNVTGDKHPDTILPTAGVDVEMVPGETREWRAKGAKIGDFNFLRITNLVGQLDIELKQTQNTTCATLQQSCKTRACLFTIFPCMLGPDQDQIYVSVTAKLLPAGQQVPGANVTFHIGTPDGSGTSSGSLNSTQADFVVYPVSSLSAVTSLQVSKGVVNYAIYRANACNGDPVSFEGSVSQSEANSAGIPIFQLNAANPDADYWDGGYVVILTGGQDEISRYALSGAASSSGELAFCKKAVDYSYQNILYKGDSDTDPRDDRAAVEYALLVQGFGCPSLGKNKPSGLCTACSNFVTPSCATALTLFACWDSFRKVSSGNTLPVCENICAAVESSCGVTWEEAGFSQFGCNSTMYTPDSECTGTASEVPPPSGGGNSGGGGGHNSGGGGGGGKSNTGKTVGIVVGSVAGVAAIAGIAFAVTKMGGSAAAGAAGGSSAGAASGGAAASSAGALKEPLLPDGGGAAPAPDAATTAV